MAGQNIHMCVGFNHILIYSFSSAGDFKECEVCLRLTDRHIRYFPCRDNHLGNITMFFSTLFFLYLLVKEMSELIYAPSRAAWVGCMSHTDVLADAAGHQCFKTLFSTFHFCVLLLLHTKYPAESPWPGWVKS